MRSRVQFECETGDLADVMKAIGELLPRLGSLSVTAVAAPAPPVVFDVPDNHKFPRWVSEMPASDLHQLSYAQVMHWLTQRGIPFKVNTPKRELIALGMAAPVVFATTKTEPNPLERRLVKFVLKEIADAPGATLTQAALEASLVAEGFSAKSAGPATSILRSAGKITWSGRFNADRSYALVRSDG